VIELKNAADENATLCGASNQLKTYKREIPSLFPTNELLIIADWERFMPWRTIEGETISPKGSLELEVLIKGICERSRFLDVIRYFVVFEVDGASIIKNMAGYHQYHAVNKAVARTVQAIR
jgi:type I restriction enzyme, R subunit